jgi:hypothetical protein
MVSLAAMKASWAAMEERLRHRETAACAPMVRRRSATRGRTTRRSRSWKVRMEGISLGRMMVLAVMPRAGTSGVPVRERAVMIACEGAMVLRGWSLRMNPAGESKEAKILVRPFRDRASSREMRSAAWAADAAWVALCDRVLSVSVGRLMVGLR